MRKCSINDIFIISIAIRFCYGKKIEYANTMRDFKCPLQMDEF